jgi:hypothetical protein
MRIITVEEHFEHPEMSRQVLQLGEANIHPANALRVVMHLRVPTSRCRHLCPRHGQGLFGIPSSANVSVCDHFAGRAIGLPRRRRRRPRRAGCLSSDQSIGTRGGAKILKEHQLQERVHPALSDAQVQLALRRKRTVGLGTTTGVNPLHHDGPARSG